MIRALLFLLIAASSIESQAMSCRPREDNLSEDEYLQRAFETNEFVAVVEILKVTKPEADPMWVGGPPIAGLCRSFVEMKPVKQIKGEMDPVHTHVNDVPCNPNPGFAVGDKYLVAIGKRPKNARFTKSSACGGDFELRKFLPLAKKEIEKFREFAKKAKTK